MVFSSLLNLEYHKSQYLGVFSSIFSSMTFTFLQEDLHNFADDNTVSAIADSLQALLEVFTEKANTAIDWFQLNDMIVNPGKFKAILLEKNKQNTSEYPIVLMGHEIKMQESVTLLGVSIDYKLSFEEHVVLMDHQIKMQESVTLLGVTTDYKLSFEEHVSNLCQKLLLS